jgi:eukaryotic-like serine/threonine-protein kinase
MTERRVGHYLVLEKIGAGAMGEVFRARDERLGRDVALKLIKPASSDNPDHLRRFEIEARAAAALNHPNILAIYDVGFEGSFPYIVSELLQGHTLRQRLMAGPIPVSQAADFALQIALGLTAAHARHIVHRDLKPENLFITEDGRIKILDFGVAKLQTPADEERGIDTLTTVTKSGFVIGTVAYMAPEQLRGKPVDHRSDIFSFGAILYEMLTAKRAFSGETEVDTMTAVLLEQPPDTNLQNSAIPQPFQEIVRHCLEKEPENRFQSAKDLGFALQTLSGSSPGREISFSKPKPRTKRILPWAIAAVLASTSLVFLLIAVQPSAPAAKYQRLTSEPGTVYAGRFAPDGRSIVYSAAWNNHPVQAYSTVGNSLLSQPLNLGDAGILAISKTHELAVVLHGTHTGQLETVHGMLASAPLAGGSPKELLADVRWADWDPDGQLAVVHNVEGHSRLEYPIGHVLYQSGGWISHIRFNPDGNKIAFMEHPAQWDDRGTVAVVDMGGHVQVLSKEWESESGLAWRPDGKEILFTAAEKGNNLSLMAVDTKGKIRSLLDLPVGLTLQDIAADGRLLATVNSKRLAMAATTLGSKEDVELSWHDWNVAKDISPDGQWVLFEDSSEAAGPKYAVALRKLDGTPPIRLGDGSAGGLSPDGKWAISVSLGAPIQVALLPIRAGQARTLNVTGLTAISNGNARFLADGQRIVVNAKELGRANRCYLLDMGGAKPKPLTPEGWRCGPSSPDSKFMVGIAANAPAALYSVDGGSSRVLPGTTADLEPVQWSKDSRSLYAYRFGEFPGRMYKFDIATGKMNVVQELHPAAPAGVVLLAPIIVNRDGTLFAYSYSQTLSTLYLISGVR